MTNYVEKIQKLLALANSDNENEAKAALLKAHELMAEYKLEEADVVKGSAHSVKEIATGVTCTRRKNAWIMDLSAVIAKNYCCVAIRRQARYGSQIGEVAFTGLDEDCRIACSVFEYAVDCVMSGQEEIRKQIKCAGTECTGRQITRICDAYGEGFVDGVDEMYECQNGQHEKDWGLVLVVPQAVHDYLYNIGVRKSKSYGRNDAPTGESEKRAEKQGFRDGREFRPERRVAQA